MNPRGVLLKIRNAAVAGAAVAIGLLAGAANASAWAPAATAPIHPGVQTFTNGAQCTANFIFQDGGNTYIGQAAHCSGTGSSTDTNGCTSGSLPIGTAVQVTGASKPGTLAYNSWLTMQGKGETDANACAGNDIALVRLDPADVANVNPSVPFWGGPTGLLNGTVAAGGKVLSYGNSELRGGVTTLSPKEGVSIGDSNGGWTHEVYTVTPGIPGDSGSGFFDKTGKAFGVLSVLEIAPTPLANGVSDLAKELAYMHANGGPAANLVNGTEPFRGPILPRP
jgi:hypothetical protein